MCKIYHRLDVYIYCLSEQKYMEQKVLILQVNKLVAIVTKLEIILEIKKTFDF